MQQKQASYFIETFHLNADMLPGKETTGITAIMPAERIRGISRAIHDNSNSRIIVQSPWRVITFSV
jgi:hypothetical protein